MVLAGVKAVTVALVLTRLDVNACCIKSIGHHKWFQYSK